MTTGRGVMRVALPAFGAALVVLPASASARAQPAPRHVQSRAHASIVGGTAATPGSLPSLAFVVDDEGSQYGLCSGTVVAANVMLTAAHCVLDSTTGQVDPASNFAVVTGDVDWTDTAARQVSAVSSVAVYPQFEVTTQTDCPGLFSWFVLRHGFRPLLSVLFAMAIPLVMRPTVDRRRRTVSAPAFASDRRLGASRSAPARAWARR